MIGFSPVSALVGGALIGAAVGLLWIVNGRVAGISSILGGLVSAPSSDIPWRLLFLAGLPIGATLGVLVVPRFFASMPGSFPALDLGPFGLVVAGLLVGIGSGLARGCTSGHGIFGLATLSRRSIVAVLVFMTTAVSTVLAYHHLS